MNPLNRQITLIEEVCFGTLVEYVDGALYAAHIPLHFDKDRKWAYGHLAKANELAAKWVLGGILRMMLSL